MNHFSWDDIWAYLDGDLTDADGTIVRHLAACHECTVRIQQAKAARTAVTEAFRTPRPGQNEDRFHENLLGLLQDLQSEDQPVTASPGSGRRGLGSRRTRHWWTTAGSAVAALAVGTYVGLQVWQSHTGIGMIYGPELAHLPVTQSTAGQMNGAMATRSGTALAGNKTDATTGNTSGTVVGGSAGKAMMEQSMRPSTTLPPQTQSNTQSGPTGGQLTKGTNDAAQTHTLAQANLQGLASSSAQMAPSQHVQGIEAALQVAVQGARVQQGTPVPDGQSLAGAHVAILSGGSVVATGVTGSDGTTTEMTFSVSVDPMLGAAYFESGLRFAPLPAQGSATVVVWKDGYQPYVDVGYGVDPGAPGTSTQLLVGLLPLSQATAPVRDDVEAYPLLEVDGFARWVQAMAIPTAGSTSKPGVPSGETSTQVGRFSFRVQDQAGKPIAGVHVALLRNAVIAGLTLTNSTGASPALADAGVPDWRGVIPAQTPPSVVTLVAWKQGYASAVGFYQPVVVGSERTVHITLQSLAWRQSQTMNNLDAAMMVPGDRVPSSAELTALVNWLTAHTH